MAKYKILIFILCFMAASSRVYASDLEAKASNGICRIYGQLASKIMIELDIKMRARKDKPAASIEKGRWSDDFLGNLLPIDLVVMKINGQGVLIPNSAFSDLGSVKSAKVHQSKNAIFVTVACGEGGDSMTATFKVEQSKRLPGRYQVIERTLRAGGFEDDVWEQTIYHNNVWDNPDL